MTSMIIQIKMNIQVQLVMTYHFWNANSHSKSDEKCFIVVLTKRGNVERYGAPKL